MPKLTTKQDYLISQAGRCHYCQRPIGIGRRGPDEATWDHIIPRSRGGRGLLDNKVLACKVCNTEKGILSAEEFRLVIQFRNRQRQNSTSPQLQPNC